MPELPEVETVRRTLAPAIGEKIASVWGSGLGLHQRRVPPLTELRRTLVGTRITAARRRGKVLLVDCEPGAAVFLCHLGMSGRLRLYPAADPRPPHTHVVLGLGARELRFSDPRRFGLIDLTHRGDESAHPSLAGLGRDPLAEPLSGDYLRACFSGRRAQVKALLLDQRHVAGIGNIYACEALWRAGISPFAPGHRLGPARADRLAEAIAEVIAAALGHGGTSLRDFVSADGRTGSHAEHLEVYGHTGAGCPRPGCGGIIRRAIIAGRATFFCPRCQHR